MIDTKNSLKERFIKLEEEDSGHPWFYDLIKNSNNPKKYIDDALEDDSRVEEISSLINQMESIKDTITSEKEKNKYKELRKAEYGEWRDQLDEIYHDIDAWRSRISGIKTKYPKPKK